MALLLAIPVLFLVGALAARSPGLAFLAALAAWKIASYSKSGTADRIMAFLFLPAVAYVAIYAVVALL